MSAVAAGNKMIKAELYVGSDTLTLSLPPPPTHSLLPSRHQLTTCSN